MVTVSRSLFLYFSLIFFLAACSGGGSDNSTGTPPPTAASLTASASGPATGVETDSINLSVTASNSSGTVTYAWTQTAGPASLIDGADTANPTVRIPLLNGAVDLIFQVSVQDGSGASSSDTVTVRGEPVAGASRLEVETIHDRVRRTYTVYTPEDVEPMAPLIMFLHGARGGMREFIADGETPQDWMTLADRDGFVVVYPNGYSNTDGDGLGDNQSWNDLNGQFSEGDDAGFLLSVIEEVAAGRNISTGKVLIGGRSNGGMMSFRMAIEHPTRFAAVASFVGNLAKEPIPMPTSLPTPPIFIFGGTDDPLVPFEGGVSTRSIPETVAYFVDTTNTDVSRTVGRVSLPDSDPDDGCSIVNETYTDVVGFITVQYYEGIGGGHYIPDPDFVQSQQNINARGPIICRDANGIDLAYDFFLDVLTNTPADPPSGSAQMTFDEGANSLFIGQSFYVPVASAFSAAVGSGDFPQHAFDFFFQGGRNGAPSALWENSTWRTEIESKLSTGDVELFGMTIPNGTEENVGEAYGNWVNLAFSYNPDTAIFVGFPYLTRGYAQEPSAFEQQIVEGGEAFYPIIEALRDGFPNNKFYFINYGIVLSKMMVDFEGGELEDIVGLVDPSGMADGGDGYIYEDDTTGHAGPMAEHIAGLVWAHYFYGADIQQLVDPAYNSEDVLRIANEVIAFNRRYLPASDADPSE